MTCKTIPMHEWSKLLTKARSEGLVLITIAHTSNCWAESHSHPGEYYMVGPSGCECPAGSHDRPCKHLALWLVEHMHEHAASILRDVLVEMLDEVRQSTKKAA